MKRSFLTFLVTAFLFAPMAYAKNPQKVGRYKDWSVLKVQQNGKNVYYTLTYPKQKKGNYTKRGDVYMIVSSTPKSKEFNVVAFHAGYPLKTDGKVTVQIDKQKFSGLCHGETIWFSDAVDKKLVDAMRRGKKLTVIGYSKRGTKTTDTYSLAGSSSALKKLNSLSRTKG